MKRTFTFINDTSLLIILAIAGMCIHIALNGQYGFHRDELDFILNARQLDWGYISYPPITPFVARLGLEVFGESLRGLRVFPALAQGIVMLLAGLVARELGGKRSAQLVTAIAVYIAPVSLMGGTLLMYFPFDYLWWTLVAFFTVRLLARGDQRNWLGIGAAIGLGMLTKYTMAFWVAGLVIATLLSPLRVSLKSRWLWLGAALALLIFSPNLLWQIQHGFISLEYLASIHARDIAWGRADNFLVDQLYTTTNPFTLPLWMTGLTASLFAVSMRRFRPLAILFLVTFSLFILSQGRGYYTGPSYIMLLALGSVWFENWLGARSGATQRAGFGLLYGMLAAGSLVGIVLIKPIAPVNSSLWKITSEVNGEVREMIGWPELVQQVTDIYEKLSESEKPRAVILAGNYGEAGALDFYGEGLPPVISGSNSLWTRGYGAFEPETVIVVGFERPYTEKFFAACEYAGTVTNPYNVRNEESTRHTGLYVCRQPRRPWSEMWPEMRWYQ